MGRRPTDESVVTTDRGDPMSVVERIGPLDDLKPGTARQVVIGDHRIALVRIEDDVYAIGDICTHQDISLSEGEVLPEDRTIECWKHGSAFSLETGEPEALPATKPVPVYVARVVDGQIEVEIG
jgi:3-phenylpropionate/trans-cinnamate dioxygenase ferredoxin subunit